MVKKSEWNYFIRSQHKQKTVFRNKLQWLWEIGKKVILLWLWKGYNYCVVGTTELYGKALVLLNDWKYIRGTSFSSYFSMWLKLLNQYFLFGGGCYGFIKMLLYVFDDFLISSRWIGSRIVCSYSRFVEPVW